MVDTTLIPTRLRQPWMFTQAEITDAIYNGLKGSLRKGSCIPTRIKGVLHVIASPLQVMRYIDGSIMVRLNEQWTPVERNTMDAWAQTLGLVGPTQHFLTVERAIKDEYPVEKHVIAEYAANAGMDRKSKRLAKKSQPTRTVTMLGSVLCLDKAERPCANEQALWGNKRLAIVAIESYRKFDCQWLVRLEGLEGQYAISRVETATRLWRVSFKAVFSK